MDTKSKSLSTYVDRIVEKTAFKADNIIVERRTGNKKRDFLFVNKAQCMHMPSRPEQLSEMCRELAKEAEKIIPKDKKVLVIGFAETATAIGALVADYLPCCSYYMTTTRETIRFADTLVEFKEEHSHAENHAILTHNGFDMHDFGYVLLVDDEISTGNTMKNLITKLRNRFGEGIGYGIASVCNWMPDEKKKEWEEKGIRQACLITGVLKDANMKVNGCFREYKESPVEGRGTSIQTYLFARERLGRKPNPDFSAKYAEADRLIEKYHPEKVCVIGTEECKYLPFKVAEHIKEKGVDVTCQTITRSPIDVMEDASDGIVMKRSVPSLYGSHPAYIYNIEKADFYMVVTDVAVNMDIAISLKHVIGDKGAILCEGMLDNVPACK